jgi:hypothetical protein
MPVTERRKFMRFETALNALCEIVSGNVKSSLEIKNISKDGALLILAKQLTQGSELKLSMDVPGDNVPIFASCEVAWQKATDSKGAGFETGVKFTNIENADKGRLLEYIYTQWLRFLDNSR